MKSKFKIAGVFLFFAVFASVNFMSIASNSNNDLNLDALMKVAKAGGESGGNGLECRCRLCPNDDTGCWAYDYNSSNNSGYEGTWLCKPPGYIEMNVPV